MSISESPRRKSQRQSQRKRQEARWARKSGPVTVRFDPSVRRAVEGSQGISQGVLPSFDLRAGGGADALSAVLDTQTTL
jgi:hypothetical protein